MGSYLSQFEMLSHAIEFAQQHHRVISQNLANVNTPNYLTRQLSFAQFLESIERGGSAGSAPPEYDLQLTEGLATRADGNNVDLNRELGNLKRNDLIYQTLIQLMGAKIDAMKLAIRG